MKKLIFFTVVLNVHFLFAQDELKYCGADELRISSFIKKPAMAEAIEKREQKLEAFTKNFVKDFYDKKTTSTTYIIPVVFHVIHKWGNENISDAQIYDGIDVLNKTFRKQLADTATIAAAFKPLHADCEIEFRLAQKDPDGNCTSGINRIASALTTTGDHAVKSIIQWPPDKYLNIYVVSNAAGLAGHAIWPSDADTIPEWDGIVIGYNYVGSIGQSNYTRSVVLAHECGHYLNLHHIWGGNNVPGFYYYPAADPNKDCGIDDLVEDTPPTIGWQSCNLNAASCGNAVDNVQNAMDYSYCNRMFTYGQKARMQACLNSPIGGRNNLWQTANLIATGVLNPDTVLCKADFTSAARVICAGAAPVVFTNTSFFGNIDTVEWAFPGGSPATSSSQNPSVNYNVAGTYDVSLKVIQGLDTVEITKPNYITVMSGSPVLSPFSEDFENSPSLTGPDWYRNSPDTINSWELTSAASYSGTKSIMLNNAGNGPAGTKDELISKLFDLTGTANLNISFKYAFAAKDSNSKDQLQVFITNSCNSNWLQRLNLTGSTLETAPPQASPFFPSSVNEWKSSSVTIPAGWLTAGFRFKFIHLSYGGNNIFLDDINLDVLSSDAMEEENSLKDFILSPNPASNVVLAGFEISRDSRISISISDVLGKNVFKTLEKNYTSGEHSIPLDLRNLKQGLYIIKLFDGYRSQQKVLVIGE